MGLGRGRNLKGGREGLKVRNRKLENDRSLVELRHKDLMRLVEALIFSTLILGILWGKMRNRVGFIWLIMRILSHGIQLHAIKLPETHLNCVQVNNTCKVTMQTLTMQQWEEEEEVVG